MNNSELRLDQHEQAVKLHQEIMVSASLAQQNIWTMCTKLKEMRDGKLYKALGYKSFEEYCENEVGFSRMNAYRYISIAEKVNPENVTPGLQIGMKKLYLLSTISESKQHELSEKVNLEETTVKQLKAEIDKLKKDCKEFTQLAETLNTEKNILEKELEEKIQELKDHNKELFTKAQKARDDAQKAQKKEQEAWGKLSIATTDNEMQREAIAQLEKENKELRNRPIDIAVVDRPIENDPKFKEIIRSLERENMKRNEEMDRQYIEDRRQLEADKQREINAIRDEYEKKLAEAVNSEPMDEDKLKFKIYLTSTYDMLNRLTEFTSQHNEPIYKEKIKQLLNSVLVKMEG